MGDTGSWESRVNGAGSVNGSRFTGDSNSTHPLHHSTKYHSTAHRLETGQGAPVEDANKGVERPGGDVGPQVEADVRGNRH